jgi:hypothetical protein
MEDLSSYSPSFRLFIQLTNDIQTAVWLQYLLIIGLTIVVFKLGFAKKLPLLKNIVIYVSLSIGCLILLLLSYQLPIVEGLFVAALILIIYKIRLQTSKNAETEAK